MTEIGSGWQMPVNRSRIVESINNDAKNWQKMKDKMSEPFNSDDLSRSDVLIVLERCINKLQAYQGIPLFLARVSYGSKETDQDIKLLNKTAYSLYASTINTPQHEEALKIIRKLNPKV